MISIRTVGMILLLSAASTAFVRPAPSGSTAPFRRHTHLVKSEPAADDTLATSPRAIRLWFSEQVELPVTTVKLGIASGANVSLAALARPDTGQSAPVTAMLTAPLKPGAYVVTWSTAAKDGHPASGTFNFVVKAAR
jgi:methionine-rich copper-binding protein CopC